MICEVSGRFTRQVDGLQVGVPGEMHWRPTLRLVEVGYVQLPEPQTILVDNDGYFSISVESTGATWCWEVKEDVPSGIIRYVAVPATAAEGYGQLQDVDKSTLVPSPGAVPAWTAATTIVQGYAADALVSKNAASGSAGAAAGSAADALVSENAASGSAGAAAGSAGDALASAGLSDGYADAAGISAGAAAQSASDANVSAGAAAGSAGAASGSAGDAAGSAGAASDSAATALASKNAAAVSEGNAAGSAAAAAATLAGAVPKSLIDAKGDLLAGSADNTPVRLAAAANGSVLVTDSAQASGLKYEGPTVFHKTTAQTLSTAEKTQALANLGVTLGTTVGAMPYVSDANGSIKAQPVVPLLKNMLANSDFTSGTTTGWLGTGGSLTNEGNTLILTAADAVTPGYVTNNTTILAGNQYYVSVRFTPFRTHNMLISLGDVYLNSPNSAAAGIATQVSATITALQARGFVGFYSNNAVTTGQTTGARVGFDNAVCIDLTATFGAGFEPTKSEMDALMEQWGGWFADTDPKLLPSYVWAKRAVNATPTLLDNSRFVDTSRWSVSNCTVSAASQALTLTPTGASATFYAVALYATPIFRNGQKIYIRGQIRTDGPTTPTNLKIGFGGAGPSPLYSPTPGAWYVYSGVAITPTSGVQSTYSFSATYADTASTVGTTATIRFPLAIDLTSVFGAGNEPTASEMDLLLAKYPNSWFSGTVNDLVKDFDKWNRRGVGSPEGVVTAAPGVKWIDTAVTNGAAEWIKKTGTGNTGWVVTNGDTGWRDIAVWDSAGTFSKGALGANWSPRIGITEGSVSVRRINSTVYVAISQVKTVIAANTAAIATIPVGFTASSAIANHPSLIVKFSSGGTPTVFGMCSTLVKDDLFAYTPDDYIYRAKLEFVCDVAWPTSLP